MAVRGPVGAGSRPTRTLQPEGAQIALLVTPILSEVECEALSKSAFKQIKAGLKEAIDVAKGEAKPYRLHTASRNVRSGAPKTNTTVRAVEDVKTGC